MKSPRAPHRRFLVSAFLIADDLENWNRMSRIAGFEGFVYKMNAAHDLLRGVRAVLSGNKFYDSQLIQARTA